MAEFLDIYTISVLIFFAILGVVIYRDRKNIEHKYFIFYKRKTKHGQNLLDKIVHLSPRIWKIVGVIAIIWAFLAMGGGVYLLLQTVNFILSNHVVESGIRIILPSPTSQPIGGFGFVLIPFWFWIITIAIVMIPHEIFHGIMARLDKIKINSMGVFLLAIFPGAFVDPNQRQFNKSKLYNKLRIIAAGTFANILTAAIVFAIAAFVIWPTQVQPGALITNVTSGSPAQLSGLQPGMVIQEINGEPVTNSYQEYFAIYSNSFVLSNPQDTQNNLKEIVSFISVFSKLNKYSPEDKISVKADGENFDLTLTESPNVPGRAYMGVSSTLQPQSEFLFNVAFPLLSLIIFVTFVVGVLNMLPIGPLDGGVFLRSILDRFTKNYSGKISLVVSYFVILLFISTAVLPLLIRFFI